MVRLLITRFAATLAMYAAHLSPSRRWRIWLHFVCRRVDLPLPQTSQMAGRSRLCEAMGGRIRSVITHCLAAVVDSVLGGLVEHTVHLVGALLVLTLQFVDDFLYQ